MTLEAQSLACGTEMCVRRVVNKSGLTMHWKLCCIGGKHESLVLTYIRGVCVFPARSGFTPGWACVLVGG